MNQTLITKPANGPGGSGALTVLSGPVFSLRIDGSSVALVLQGAPLPGGADISKLVMSMPHVSFPFDFREGIERFRHHRGAAEVLELAVDARVLLDWLHRMSDGRLGGTAHDDTMVLSGRTRHGARYTVRGRLIADAPTHEHSDDADVDEPTIVLTLYQVRVFGLVAEPWPVLAGRIIDLLPKDLVVDRTLTTARIRLVRPALAWALSGLGWKLPDLQRLQTRGVELRGGRLTARFLSSDAVHRQEILALEGVDDVRLRGAFERFVEDLELKRHHGQIDRLLGQRQIREALAEVYRALDGPPQPGFLAERLIGICASQPVLYDEGERVCRELLAISPSYEPALCGLASIAIGRGRREEAAVQLERLAASLTSPADREDATACDLTVAEILRETGHDDARASLARVLERSPDHEEALEALIEISEAEGNAPATLPLYKRLLFAARSKERTRDAGLRLARHALDRAQPEEARVFLRVVLEAARDDFEAQVALAEVETLEDNPVEAARILDAALRVVPSTDEENTLRVIVPLARLCLDEMNDQARARRALWRAVDVVNFGAGAALDLAGLALEAEDPALAERFLDRVGLKDPRWPEAAALRAEAHLAAGDADSALQVILDVLDAQPQNDTALSLLERCTPDLHQRELLVHRLKVSAQVAEDAFDKARILHRVATLYESLNLPWDAIEPYEQALRAHPDGRLAQLTTDRLLELYAMFGMWPKHQELCRERLPRYVDPEKRVQLLIGLGRVALVELEQSEPARDYLQEAVELAPRNLEALTLLRDALESLEQGIALIKVLTRLEAIHADAGYRDQVRIRLAELQLEGLDAPGQARATLARLPPEAQADPRVRTLRRRLGLAIDAAYDVPEPAAPAPKSKTKPKTMTVPAATRREDRPAALLEAMTQDAAPRVALDDDAPSWEDALDLADRGALAEALQLLEGVLERNPSNVPAQELTNLIEARMVEAGMPPRERVDVDIGAQAVAPRGRKPRRKVPSVRSEPHYPRTGGKPRTDEFTAPPLRAEARAMSAGVRTSRDATTPADDVTTLDAHIAEADRIDALIERADAEMSVARYDTARKALAEVLDRDADHVAALERMNQVLATTADHAARVPILERLADLVFDAEASSRHLKDLGQVYASALNNEAAAAEPWRRYLLWQPLEDDLFERVRLELLMQGKQAALAELYERRAEAMQDVSERAPNRPTLLRAASREWRHAAMLRLADLDTAAAIAAAEQGLALAAEDPELLETLVRALAGAGRREEAAKVVDTLLPQLLDDQLKDELLKLVDATA